ncbi:YdcF family protein [Thalassospira lucentensis]|uniref:YdcF family protein n=1 Tax=Thalassospira lucentensis TaxID=168935 RepID=UPI003D2EC718
MFYFLSKTVGYLINISLVHGIVLFALFCLLFLKRTRRFSLCGLVGVTALSLLITAIPLGAFLSQTLETRFERPDLGETEFAGVVTLSGSIDPASYLNRGEVQFLSAPDRVFTMLRLANQYPTKPVIFTGGDGALSDRGFSEGAVLAAWLGDSKMRTPNMHFETKARNTYENALNSHEMVYGKWPELAQKPWVLVTSADHMPRAVGVFRQAGWKVIPYPVGRFTSDGIHLASLNVSGGIKSLGRGLREWVGLTAYYWTGRSNEWFPGPQSEATEN